MAEQGSVLSAGIRWLQPSRVLVVDPSEGELKLHCVERDGGRVRWRRTQRATGADSKGMDREEAREVLRQALSEFPGWPLVYVLPGRISLSQTADLSGDDPAMAADWIERQTAKLSGLSDSTFVHDHAALKPFSHYHYPCWITLCREEEIHRNLNHWGLEEGRVAEVVNIPNALIGFHQQHPAPSLLSVLAFMDADATSLVFCHGGQGIGATSFSMGMDELVDIAADSWECGLSEAKERMPGGLLSGSACQAPEADVFLKQWRKKLIQTVSAELTRLDLSVTQGDFISVRLAGSAAGFASIAEFLNRPDDAISSDPGPYRFVETGEDYSHALAIGAASHAFGLCRQRGSMLPAPHREVWRKKAMIGKLHALNLVLLLLAALLIAIGTVRKQDWIDRKRALLRQTQDVRETMKTTQDMAERLVRDYERLRPLLRRQKETLDTLKALALLQNVRSNQNFWFVLFSDQVSYFASDNYSTNLASRTNLLNESANMPVIPYGFIAEVVIPEEGEKMRSTLSEVASALKQPALFDKVDTLSTDRRRQLVSTNVIIPNRHFAISMELASLEFRQPVYVGSVVKPASDPLSPGGDSKTKRNGGHAEPEDSDR